MRVVIVGIIASGLRYATDRQPRNSPTPSESHLYFTVTLRQSPKPVARGKFGRNRRANKSRKGVTESRCECQNTNNNTNRFPRHPPFGHGRAECPLPRPTTPTCLSWGWRPSFGAPSPSPSATVSTAQTQQNKRGVRENGNRNNRQRISMCELCSDNNFVTYKTSKRKSERLRYTVDLRREPKLSGSVR